MGASVAGGGGGGGRRRGSRRGGRAPMAEINVTPFVDVMLVLLIIFMVAAPLLTVGVPIELPETDAQEVSSNEEPLTISLGANGEIFLQESEIALDDLVGRLTAIAEGGYDEAIFIRGDKSIDYGQVMQVMGRINAAGFKRVSLITGQAG